MPNLLGTSLNIPVTKLPADGTLGYSIPSVGARLTEVSNAVQSTFGGQGFFVRPAQGINAATTAAVSTSQYTANAVRTAVGDPQRAENTYHKVTLSTVSTSVESGEIVEFDIMPDVSEVRSVDYEPLSPPQLIGEFQKYRGTKSTQWTITATFTCRTRQEAQKNLTYVNRLRGWTMSFFGQNQTQDKLGAPPPVLKFSGWRGLVGEVPVVITNLNWTWPKECDWIPTLQLDEKNQEPIPFPTVMVVNIQLTESFSAVQFNNFDLEQFKSGYMIRAFSSVVNRTPPSVAERQVTGGNQAVANATPIPVPKQVNVTEAVTQKAVSVANTAVNAASDNTDYLSEYINNNPGVSP